LARKPRERIIMNTRESALLASMATAFCILVCQVLAQLAGHRPQLSSTQAMSGLTFCLAGVALGLLLALCASAWQGYGSGLSRSLSALGLALGFALLVALLMGHRPARAESTQLTHQESANGTPARTVLLARGAWR